MNNISCGECGSPMVLRKSAKFPKPFWGCSRFPDCRGTHGAHADGRPLGVPANKETKAARIEAHRVFDVIWQNNFMSRSQAYKLLAKKLGVKQVHIGESDIETCEKIMRACKEIFYEEVGDGEVR